ncbi:hypothetical protein [Kitasatospora mediocidica]|uniref:hypothetical protein n=1 Tax=Kitasatospora mediocidica TaxID=58352 RepID=UPI00055A53D6|nr:hypothetical protein [Kitasatospora mediocidica]
MQVAVGAGFGTGVVVGFVGAEGATVPGRVLVPPGAGVVADGRGAVAEAAALAEATAVTDAEGEGE